MEWLKVFLFLWSGVLIASDEFTQEFQAILREEGVAKAGLVVRDHRHHSLLKVDVGGMDFGQPIPIASATKWVTAATILRVLEKRGISLDQSVASYLKKAGLSQLPPEKLNFTFRQLLSFQSRMTGKILCMYLGARWMTTKKCVKRVLEKSDLREKPGFEYNSLHMTVLGRVIEVIEGKSWNEIFNDEFKSFFSISDSQVTYYASPKKKKGSHNPLVPGGLVISGQDYLRFLQMLYGGGELSGKRFLSRKTVVEMHRDQFLGADFPNYHSPYKNLNVNPHYGLGNWVESPSINSSGGAFGFYPWLDKKRQYYAIYTTLGGLREHERSFRVVQKIRQRLMPKLLKK